MSIDYERINLFYDEETDHFCFQNCSETVSDYVYFIGEHIQNHYDKNNLEAFVIDLQEVF